MSLLRRGDVVRTVCELRSAARRLPKGAVGVVGRFLRSELHEEEFVEVFDFVPADYPGIWSVTEYTVKLLHRDRK